MDNPLKYIIDKPSLNLNTIKSDKPSHLNILRTNPLN